MPEPGESSAELEALIGAGEPSEVTREELLEHLEEKAAPPGVAELEELLRPVSKLGDLCFGITADANQAVETVERIRKACEAFLRAYAEPVDMVELVPGEEYTRGPAYEVPDFETGDDLKAPPNTGVEGPISGRTADVEIVDELTGALEAASAMDRIRDIQRELATPSPRAAVGPSRKELFAEQMRLRAHLTEAEKTELDTLGKTADPSEDPGCI